MHKTINIIYAISTFLTLLIVVYPLYFITSSKLNFDISYQCIDENGLELMVFQFSSSNYLDVSTTHSSEGNSISKEKLFSTKIKKELRQILGSIDSTKLMQVHQLNNQNNDIDIGQLLIFDYSFDLDQELPYAVACVKKMRRYKNGILPSRMHEVYKVYSITFVDEFYFNIKNNF